jgi:hypothetical protein
MEGISVGSAKTSVGSAKTSVGSAAGQQGKQPGLLQPVRLVIGLDLVDERLPGGVPA